MARQYSSIAGQMTLQSGVTASTPSITVDAVAGLPGTTPFTLAVDYGAAQQELVEVTAVSGTTLTVTRGIDGTSGSPHSAGAVVKHVASARDFAEPQAHLSATGSVHGVAGTLVGTTDAQSLDNKVFVSTSGSTVPVKVRPKSGQTGTVFAVENAAGSLQVASIAHDGTTATGALTANGSVSATASSAATVGLTVKGVASQSANLVDVKDSTNTSVASVSPTGAVSAKSLSAQNVALVNASAGTAPIDVTGAPSQSAALVSVKNNAAASMFTVNAAGAVTAAGNITGAKVYGANLPQLIQSGQGAIGTLAANDVGQSGTVTFATAFSSTPVIVVSIVGDTKAGVAISIMGASATSFYVKIRNLTDTATNCSFTWIAMGAG